ncbi:MAG: thiamine diphosphokinase [Elusimicrobiota bacterium]
MAADLLLLNGALPDPRLVKRLAADCRGVLCADGGARHAAALGLEPDFIIGDMDSLPKPRPRWKKTVYWCDFDPDRSDFEKALGFALDIGCAQLFVAGALGGRLDHAMVNLALARSYSEKLEIVLVDRGTARLLKPGRYRLPLRRGDTLSLLAASDKTRLSATGLRFPLKKTPMAPGSRGLSNVARGPVSLTVHSGSVWAMTA